jgi:DNA-binding PadR family transcriptional regulator
VDADRLFRLLERVGLDDEPKVAALVGAAAAHPSPVVGQQLQKLIEVKAAGQYRYPFPESERSELVNELEDQIRLGTTFTGSSYALDPADLTKHLLVVGATGTGKTTLLYHLMDQLPVPYMAFDLKTDYRHLRGRNPNLLVVPWMHLRLNPLQPPPQVTPRSWAQTVTELIGDSYDIYSGSENYLLPVLVAMYEEHGIDVDTGYPAAEVREVAWPTFPQVRAYLQESGNTGASRTQLRNRLIDRFASIMAATGDLFTAKHGYPLAELLERDVVVELEGLKTDHQDFIIEFLLTWTFRYRQARQRRGSGVEHAFILDEGKRAFSVFKEQDRTQGIPQINYLTAEMREFGEALLVGDQEPNKLTDALHSNTGTTALFRLEEGEQFRRMVRSMQLSDRQQVFADQLETGQAIVKHGGGSAVPVQFPESGIKKTVTDTELRTAMESKWEQLTGDEISVSTSNGETETGETGPETEADAGKPPQLPTDVSAEAVHLLKDIGRHPNRSLMDRYADLFSYDKKGVRAKQELADAGLIEEYAVTVPEGSAKVVALTDSGRTVLERRHVDVERSGRGGPVHRYFQNRILEGFRKNGWTAEIEKHDADVFAEAPDSGRSVAVEVAMEARDREVQHVQDRITVADEVWVGCRNDVVRTELSRELDRADLLSDAVRVELVSAVADVSRFL